MSISLTILKGTSSISSDRITINNNFKISEDTTNELLSIVNTTTGKINNTGVGADSTITTEGLFVTETNGIEIAKGNLSVGLGNIILASDDAFIQIGSTGKVKDTTELSISGGTSYNLLDLSEGFSAVSVPSLPTTQIIDIAVGATSANYLVFDSTSGIFKGWNNVDEVWVELS